MRKVLSYVLILALVLSSFSMAFAGSSTELKTLSDVEGNANQEAIEVAYDLGIVTGNPDGTFQPTKAVTRAEFAAMITRALAIPESALAGYAKTNFKDTTGYTWAVPYLAFCNSKGIMLGDGQGNAMPGRTITLNEAVTMVLRALGYTNNSAKLQGAWPANYVSLAQDLGLYDDVAKNLEGVDKANAAQVIYNALTVQKVSVNSDGKTEEIWIDKDTKDERKATLLTTGLNCSEKEKQVIGYDMALDDALINVAKYVGQYGTVYLNDDDEIVAFIADSDTLYGRFTEKDTFVSTVDEKEYTVSYSKDASEKIKYLENGGKVDVKNSVNALVGDGNYGYNNANSVEYAIAVDLSGKTIKEIYSAVKWTPDQAKAVAKSDLDTIKDDHELLGEEFVEEDNDEIDYTQFELVGVSSLSDIKADDVVYVYADKDGIRKIEVGTKTVEGTVKSFKDAEKDSAKSFKIGDNTYMNAKDIIGGAAGNESQLEESNVGNEVKAFLDARGFVYDFEETGSSNMNFAVVEKVGGNGIDGQAKLMLADGTEKTFVYDEGKTKNNYQNYDTTTPNPNKLFNKKLVTVLGEDELIGYTLDKNGEIVDSHQFGMVADIELGSKKFIQKITFRGQNHTETNVADTLATDKNDPAKDGLCDNSDVAPTIKTAKIDDKCVVFTFDGDDYDVTTIDKVETGETILNATLLFKKQTKAPYYDANKVVAMIVDADQAKSGDKSYAVVTQSTPASNEDGDTVWSVTGYKDGSKLTDVQTDSEDIIGKILKSDNDYTDLSTVELYEIRTDAKGVITKADAVSETDTTKKVHMIEEKIITKANGRDSITVGGVGYTLSDKVVIYKLKDNGEFKLETGDLKEGDHVVLYETDDDEDGYDVVIFARY